MSIVNTIERASTLATGKVSDFRKVLDTQPHLSAFTFPPIVQKGVDIAGKFGVKVPSSDELVKLANGELDKLYGKVRTPILKQLSALETQIKGLEGLKPEEIIKKIEWLL